MTSSILGFTVTTKDYATFATRLSAPMFFQPWWLDAVCGMGSWGAAIVTNGSTIEAALPYQRKHFLTMSILTLPPYTPFLGPLLIPSKARYARALAREHRLHENLIKALPPHHAFLQCFSPSITNWQPFRWNGFKQTTRYTYMLHGLQNHDALWQETEDNIRTDIRKARTRFGLTVKECSDIDDFLSVYAGTWARQGQKIPYEDSIRRFDQACAQRQCRCMMLAIDEEGRKHAAAYIVWDSQRAYYLMGGSDPMLRSSGAHSLVIWESILRAARHVDIFDFEGSDIRPIEKHFRAFGARQIPLLYVERLCWALKLARNVRDILRARR